MMARWLVLSIGLAAVLSAGCCCGPTACGDGCCASFCLPKPIVWCGDCNECGPHGESCGDQCGECGLIPALVRGKMCGKGCGEIYWGEWVSDPPDCCDPCDDCGNWTGPQGACNLGPFQRVLAAMHGYRYCPRPDCGPVCGGLCNRGTCGAPCGCGGAGCDSCGGHVAHAAHGADIYYEGPVTTMPHGAIPHGTAPHVGGKSILEENWNIPKTTPVPGKPIHKAQQPTRAQMTRRAPAQMSYPPSQHASHQQPIGTGVRPASHQR